MIVKRRLSYHKICFDHTGHSYQAMCALLIAPSFESTCVSGYEWNCYSCLSSVSLSIRAAIRILSLGWCFCLACLRCFSGHRCRHSCWRMIRLGSDLWLLGLFHLLRYLQLCRNVALHLVGAELGFAFIGSSCLMRLCSLNGRWYGSCHRLLDLAGFQSEYCFWYKCFVIILSTYYEALVLHLVMFNNQSYIFYRSLKTGL